MLKYYSELTHHSSPKLDKTITFGGEVVETDPIIIQTQPDDESFKLMPYLLTEEEIKVYILDIVNNHLADYNNIIIVKNEQDGTDYKVIKIGNESIIKEILSSDYIYNNFDDGHFSTGSFSYDGWSLSYNRKTGIISLGMKME